MNVTNSSINPSIEILLERNQAFIEKYKSNPLVRFIKSDAMRSKENRARLLDCIQVFSDYFQKVVMLRSVFCTKPDFLEIVQIHLNEEFGHNLSLLKDRNNRPPIWDAILDATASWFVWKMFTLNDEEKTVLVHLVLEASANIFFHEAHKVMSKYGDTDYFKIHSDVDASHEHMGYELIQGLSTKQYSTLLDIQAKGWDMINEVCQRILELCHNSYDVNIKLAKNAEKI